MKAESFRNSSVLDESSSRTILEVEKDYKTTTVDVKVKKSRNIFPKNLSKHVRIGNK